MGEDAAGLDGHCEIDRVDRADAVHAAERKDDIMSVLRRYAATHETGIAALRYDWQPCLGTDAHDGSHFGGRGRADDHTGGATVEAPRLDEIRFLFAGIGNPAARTHHCFDLIERRLDLHRPLRDCRTALLELLRQGFDPQGKAPRLPAAVRTI